MPFNHSFQFSAPKTAYQESHRPDKSRDADMLDCLVTSNTAQAWKQQTVPLGVNLG